MISTRSADTDLHAGVESPRDSDGSESISALISESLLGDGITIRHRPPTGRSYVALGGLANNVVTHFVEHAFLTWLLATKHHVKPPTMPSTANCQSDDVNPEIFFPSDADLDAILWEPTLDPLGDEDANQDEAEVNTNQDKKKDAGISIAKFTQIVLRNRAKYDEAKNECQGCSFRLECLTASTIGNDTFGVWGGLDERERHLMINRFNAMRRSYSNGGMLKGMRKDFEDRAAQIANLVTQEAQSDHLMRDAAA